MPVERFDQPSGTAVYYKDGEEFHETQRHTYWEGYDPETGKCSGRVPGISTISKCDGSNPSRLLGWKERVTCEGVAKVAADSPNLQWLRDGATVLAALKQAEASADDELERAARRGTAAHSVLESLAEGVIPPFTNGYEMAAISWWKTRRPEVVECEQVVFDATRKFAGRFDLLVSPDIPTLIDLKTSKGVYASHAMQTNLYRLACTASGYPTPERLLIVLVAADGSWQEVEIPIRPEWALAAIELYKVGGEINRTLTQARKAAKRGQAELEVAA